jgi:hypothetical protein
MATTAPRLVAHPAVGSSPCLVARARRCRGRAFSIRIQGGGQRRAHRYVLQGGDDRRGAPRQSAPAGRRPSAAVDLTATTGKDIAPPVCSLPDGHGLDPLPDPDHGLDPPLGGRNRREGGGGGGKKRSPQHDLWWQRRLRAGTAPSPRALARWCSSASQVTSNGFCSLLAMETVTISAQPTMEQVGKRWPSHLCFLTPFFNTDRLQQPKRKRKTIW